MREWEGDQGRLRERGEEGGERGARRCVNKRGVEVVRERPEVCEGGYMEEVELGVRVRERRGKGMGGECMKVLRERGVRCERTLGGCEGGCEGPWGSVEGMEGGESAWS